jgi:hypothetical protein
MTALEKRVLERQLAKDLKLGWSKAKAVISLVDACLSEWGYRPPLREVTQGFVDLENVDNK